MKKTWSRKSHDTVPLICNCISVDVRLLWERVWLHKGIHFLESLDEKSFNRNKAEPEGPEERASRWLVACRCAEFESEDGPFYWMRLDSRLISKANQAFLWWKRLAHYLEHPLATAQGSMWVTWSLAGSEAGLLNKAFRSLLRALFKAACELPGAWPDQRQVF